LDSASGVDAQLVQLLLGGEQQDVGKPTVRPARKFGSSDHGTRNQSVKPDDPQQLQ
jgi:hypothetical protein